jgi:creatinine amidohydrolase
MRYASLTYLEIRKHIQAGCIAILPTGCTEQQGPHLPVDFDMWFSETVCLAVAQREQEQGVCALVLPAIPFGPTPEHRNFGSGYIHISQEIHEQIVSSVLESLAEQGIQRMIIWRGCGGHDLKSVTENFNRRYAGKSRVFMPPMPYADIMDRIAPGIPGGHGDSFCVALSLYLRPESVRADKIPNPEFVPVNWNDPNLDFSRSSSSGVIGDPTRGTIEMGEKLWSAILDEVTQTFIQIACSALI